MTSTQGANLSVLIVEDDPIQALELEWFFSDAGCDVVGVATSADEALRLIDERAPQAATLDYNIKYGTSASVAQALESNGARYVYVTALPDDVRADKMAPTGPVLQKPCNPADMLEVLAA